MIETVTALMGLIGAGFLLLTHLERSFMGLTAGSKHASPVR